MMRFLTLLNTIRFLTRGIIKPASATAPPALVRAVLLQPRVFDVASAWLQVRDLTRIGRIRASAGLDDHHRRALDYNLRVTRDKGVTTTRRAEIVYQMLALPPRDLSRERLLIVGPRNIQELFIAWLYGFNWERITAIDLYSTNPKIIVMNMERMTFADATFDSVAMANTLAYAADTRKAVAEVARVLRPGGHFAFGATYDPTGTDWPGNLVSGAEIKSMLDEFELDVVFYTPVDKVNSHGGRQTTHMLSTRKRDPAAGPLDRINL